MPLTGGIIAPTIIPLKQFKDGTPVGCIDTGTYIELKSETPNAKIFFTTDGSTPNPWRKKSKGREMTFTYKAPFALRPGRRIIKAMAVHNVTQVESHVVTKQFTVCDINKEYPENETQYDSDSIDSEDEFARDDMQQKAIIRRHEIDQLDDSIDNFLRRNTDQGFAATNHSGTQINLWGQVPGLNWDVRAPNSANIYGSYFTPVPSTFIPPVHQPTVASHVENGVTYQQLTVIANQLSQCIDQTRHMTIAEVRELLKQMSENISVQKLEASRATRPLLAISHGGGDLPGQLEHIRAHLLEYTCRDPQLSARLSNARMGKIVSADFDEDESSFLLTIQLERPGVFRSHGSVKPRSKPVKRDSEDRDQPTTPSQPAVRPRKDSPEQPAAVSDETSQPKDSPVLPSKSRGSVTENLSSPSIDEDDPPWMNGVDEYAPTLRPYENFNASDDCEKLRKAMKGLGTDEKAIIEIMGRRSVDQRTKIVLQFKTMYGKDLVKEFKSELSGHLYECVEALCYSPEEFDALQLRKAVKVAGTDEDALIEILCSRTNEQIRKVKEAYTKMHGRDLEKDVISDTSRYFKRILVSLLQANRDESTTVDQAAARRDAEELYRAGEKKLGTDESKFIMILGSKSFAHLRAVFEEYGNVSKNDIEKALKSEMSGDLLKSMLAIVRCIKNKQKYFAYQLYKSMKGLGTKDRTLIRIIVSRCEIDLARIKEEFQKEYGKPLESWVTDDTRGDYKRLLLTLISG